jgi:hypothetical protein
MLCHPILHIKNGQSPVNPDWKAIEVEVEGCFYSFNLTAGFWKDCPEFRDRGKPIIREWLQRHHSLEWPRGQPPKVELVPLGNDKFRLLP